MLTRRFLSLILIVALLLPFASAAGAEDIYSGEAVVDGFRELKSGDADQEDSSAVLTLQTKLIELGYLGGTPDGSFGSDTEIAVADFQQNNNLPRTGVADNATLALLYTGENVVPAGEVNTETDLYRTQRMLSQWGFLEESPDGRDGKNTRSAVARFRKYLHENYLLRHPLPTPEPSPTPEPTTPTGYADGEIVEDVLLHPVEEETVYSENIDLEILNFVDGYNEFDIFSKSVANGDSGDEVGRVQRRLHQLKYLAIIDEEFGVATTRALLYFQKVNGLLQTGAADEDTQRLLFSEAAQPTEEYVNSYKIYVDISDQCVYIFQWDGSGYGIPLKKFKCSTGLKGKETETPIGTYSAAGPSGTGMWYWFKKFKCYAKWGYFIVGGIMFHSVIYDEKKHLIEGSVSNLGRRASHGCIRLEVDNAKWIYDNCPAGTTVVIQE